MFFQKNLDFSVKCCLFFFKHCLFLSVLISKLLLHDLPSLVLLKLVKRLMFMELRVRVMTTGWTVKVFGTCEHQIWHGVIKAAYSKSFLTLLGFINWGWNRSQKDFIRKSDLKLIPDKNRQRRWVKYHLVLDFRWTEITFYATCCMLLNELIWTIFAEPCNFSASSMD